jgi:hypothetical protein
MLIADSDRCDGSRRAVTHATRSDQNVTTRSERPLLLFFVDFKKRFIVQSAMRDPTKVPLQLRMEPQAKALIRQLSRKEGRTMVRYLLRLVHDDARRQGEPQQGTSSTTAHP